MNGLSSEFELSTDTDDDSLVGEADSSNHSSPLDVANEALKDVDAKDREKVLNIIKMLLHENLQISLKNANLLRELQRKDDEIADLLQANRRTTSSSSNNSNHNFLTSSRSDTSSNNGNDDSPKYPSESDESKAADESPLVAVRKSVDDTDKEMDSAKAAIAKCGDSVTISVLDSTKAKTDESPSSQEFKHQDSTAATIIVTKTVIEVGTPKTNNDTAQNSVDVKSPPSQPTAPITNGTATTPTNAISSTKFGSAKSETEVIRMPLKKSVRRTPTITDDTATVTIASAATSPANSVAVAATVAPATQTAATVVVMQPHKLRDEARDKSCDKLDKISRTFDKNLRPLSPPPSANLVTAKATE